MSSNNETWVIIVALIVILIIAAVAAMMKASKGKQSSTIPSMFTPSLTQTTSTAKISSIGSQSTSDPVATGYDARDTTGPLNPSLGTSQPGQDHRTSSTQGETAPLSTYDESVIIDIPPPSYQEHTKDLRLPKPT
ncbi:hypothetical protein K450DRAFT_263742 [Umbelopsis ramanniana AG]|uniref:Uncharacterized protein n=1 Tax=Umbelopsis ramanniana AG TaxID=1314678 RepID=A0AAD5H9Z8_UMBRA|nr:uncharacterized protein K450DRAFT_263742 [Umbelopsis ramanniana AG]KAI8575026.1 hypothetical protein K450DRAFT_263742 [Umbelopsis ramanniana AG]